MQKRLATGLALLCVVLAWVFLAPVQIGGNTAYVTMRGVSMQPLFNTGDIAVLRTASSYGVGEVVAYRSGSLRTVVLHRIVAKNDNGVLTFKGDNNTWLDTDRLTGNSVVGSLVLRIPRGGLWLQHPAHPVLSTLFIFLLLAGGGAAHTRARRRSRTRSSVWTKRPHGSCLGSGRATPRAHRTDLPAQRSDEQPVTDSGQA